MYCIYTDHWVETLLLAGFCLGLIFDVAVVISLSFISILNQQSHKMMQETKLGRATPPWWDFHFPQEKRLEVSNLLKDSVLVVTKKLKASKKKRKVMAENSAQRLLQVHTKSGCPFFSLQSSRLLGQDFRSYRRHDQITDNVPVAIDPLAYVAMK
jgi:hypothetical protein